MLVLPPIYVALGSGTIEAKRIIYNKQACKLLELRCYKDMLAWPFLKLDDSQGQPKAKVLIIPTLNVASLEFLPNCGQPKINGSDAGATPSARQYVRATIRQDVKGINPTNFPSCLVHVGATDSAQFLLDFSDSEPPPSKDDNSCKGLDIDTNPVSVHVLAASEQQIRAADGSD